MAGVRVVNAVREWEVKGLRAKGFKWPNGIGALNCPNFFLSFTSSYILNFKVQVMAPGKAPPTNGQLHIRAPPCKMSSEVLLALYGKHFDNILEIEPFDLEKDNFFSDFSKNNEPSFRHLSDSDSDSD